MRLATCAHSYAHHWLHLKRPTLQAVNPIVDLITEQLDATPGGCHDMLVVGGFAASPYLMQRLKLAFSSRVSNIVQPPQSGSAIVEGAVLYGASHALLQLYTSVILRALRLALRRAAPGVSSRALRPHDIWSQLPRALE